MTAPLNRAELPRTCGSASEPEPEAAVLQALAKLLLEAHGAERMLSAEIDEHLGDEERHAAEPQRAIQFGERLTLEG